MSVERKARSALFSRGQPGGPVVIDSANDHPGNIWWVDSGQTTTGSDAVGYGRSPDKPVVTLDYIVAYCTANNQDVIYLMPGHAETKAVTGSLFALDTAGIKVIGLGVGADRPTFTMSHTGAAATMSAASVHLENVVFVCGVDSVTDPLTISAADCSLKNVEFRDSTDVEFVVGVTTTAAADRLHVDGMIYNGSLAGNACTIGISLVGCDGALIENSNFYGEFSTAVIDFTGTLCTNVTVQKCVFYNDNVALTKNVLDSATSSIWQVLDCFDGKGGYAFSGGSASAVASDSLATITGLIGASAESTQTSDLHGKIGTDAQMDNKSLYDLLLGDGPTTAPSSAAPASAVSIYEVLSAIYDDTLIIGAIESTQTSDVCGKIGTDTEMADSSLYDILAGAAGVKTAPAGATAASGVSLYEVLRFAQEAMILRADSTQTDDLMGKIGTDAEMADSSLYDILCGAAGVKTAPASAAPASGVSIYEALSAVYDDTVLIGAETSAVTSDLHGKIGTDAQMDDKSLYDLLVGDGPTTAPASAAPASAVSIYEVLSAIYDDTVLIGAETSATTDSVHGKIGTDAEMNDISLYDLLVGDGPTTAPAGVRAADDVSLYEVARYAQEVQEQCIIKAGDVLGGQDDLFDVAGGPVRVTTFLGIVTSGPISGAANCHIDHVATAPGGDIPLSTNVAIDNDAVGTAYTFTAASPGVLTPTTAGTSDQIAFNDWILPIGTLKAHCSAPQTGTVTWYMTYKPLSPSSVVTASA